MGFHRPGQVAVGAFVDVEIRDYLDRLVEEHGLETRSDALRLVISEHRAVFSQKTDGSRALTPHEAGTNDEHHMHEIHALIDNMKKLKQNDNE